MQKRYDTRANTRTNHDTTSATASLRALASLTSPPLAHSAGAAALSFFLSLSLWLRLLLTRVGRLEAVWPGCCCCCRRRCPRRLNCLSVSLRCVRALFLGATLFALCVAASLSRGLGLRRLCVVFACKFFAANQSRGRCTNERMSACAAAAAATLLLLLFLLLARLAVQSLSLLLLSLPCCCCDADV